MNQIIMKENEKHTKIRKRINTAFVEVGMASHLQIGRILPHFYALNEALSLHLKLLWQLYLLK